MNPWPWKKLILFSAIVLLPALIVGISNFTVFPDSSLAATLMLIVTVVVAGLFTWQSANATVKISRYCIIADIVICAILCFNLGGHWIMAREVSASRQGVEERHVEEDREEVRKMADAERRLKIAEAEAKLARDQAKAAYQERRRLATLPVEQRRSALKPATAEPVSTQPATGPTVATATILQPQQLTPSAPASIATVSRPKLTPEQVRERWWWFLTALAIAECAASVLAGAILAAVWEWDRNRDGIADHLQAPQFVARAYIERGQVPRDDVGKHQRHRM